MQSSYFSIQESGPDEDHQVQSPKFHKILDDEDLITVGWKEGIYGVEKSSQAIEEFVDSISILVRDGGTYGLIWNKSLQPSDGRYEPGEHFCQTREPERKSANGSVSFYRDGETGQKFAIKTLKDSDHFHPYEVKIGLVCNSPHLCAVYGVVVRSGKIHILLEHAGMELIKERSFVAESSERILTFAKQSFQALEDLHNYGYVHCDIKPDNIMIVKDQGEDFRVKIIDFGSCQPKGGILPPDAHTTRFYWSPEIWQSLNNGEQVICQPAMDVYALALTLYFVQTAGHLMNMLQERDILPLMTQRSEDLLLIALPETIPSGLRAVMRPCLAGKAEDRWSAQQAANQLDGDAMMQQALSNPRGKNYEDLFQQLLRNQCVMKTPNSSKVLPPQSCKTPWEEQTRSSCVKNETQTLNETGLPVHHFSALSKRIDRQDMGVHIKSLGSEKRQVTPYRPKKGVTPNSGKFPKPKKLLLKGSSKHFKQLCESHKVTPQPLVQDDQEVHYISSEETMPLMHGSFKRELKIEPLKKAFSGDNLRSTVNAFDGAIGSCMEECVDVEGGFKQEINRKKGHLMIDPGDNEKLSKKTKPMPMSSFDTDTQAFSCSALLITLASQARSCNKSLPLGHSNLPISPSNKEPSQTYERDKKVDKHKDFQSTFSEKVSVESICHASTSSQFQGKSQETKQTTPFHDTDGSEGKSKIPKVSNSAEFCNPVSQQTAPINSAVSREEKEDEMEFVFEALDVPQFTGRAEDILDSLCNMLDKDESKLVPNIKAQKMKELKLSQQKNKEELMEICDEGEGRRKSPNAGFLYFRERSRKRMAEDTEDNIPTKIQARQAQSDDPSDPLLPIFDKILSENGS